QIAGRALQIQVTPVSTQTVRIAALPLEGGKPLPVADDGALIPIPTAGMRSFSDVAKRSVRSGGLSVQFMPDAFQFTIQNGKRETVQQIVIDKATGPLSFEIAAAPILGLGQGGPQFDRRGMNDRMPSGQGGYRLATHGGRVPVQFAISSAGWAL